MEAGIQGVPAPLILQFSFEILSQAKKLGINLLSEFIDLQFSFEILVIQVAC